MTGPAELLTRHVCVIREQEKKKGPHMHSKPSSLPSLGLAESLRSACLLFTQQTKSRECLLNLSSCHYLATDHWLLAASWLAASRWLPLGCLLATTWLPFDWPSLCWPPLGHPFSWLAAWPPPHCLLVASAGCLLAGCNLAASWLAAWLATT